jgi:hypothetical protein
VRDIRPHLLHDPGALVTHDVCPLEAVHVIEVGVTDAAGLNLNEHFIRLGLSKLDFVNDETPFTV